MIDLETLGTKVDSVFIAIGAVVFDEETGELGEEFYVNVDWQSSLDVGRKIDASTIKWWLGQSDEARQAVLKEDNVVTLYVALNKLNTFIVSNVGTDAKVWGNGATFDISMLEHAYNSVKLDFAWKFWNIRDVRTVKDMGIGLVDEDIFKMSADKKHNALEDAKHQANYVSEVWRTLRGIK